MKRQTINPNNQKLADYFQQTNEQDPQSKKKITIVVPQHYADLLAQMSMLLGNSKTQTIKQALDHLASVYSRELRTDPSELAVIE